MGQPVASQNIFCQWNVGDRFYGEQNKDLQEFALIRKIQTIVNYVLLGVAAVATTIAIFTFCVATAPAIPTTFGIIALASLVLCGGSYGIRHCFFREMDHEYDHQKELFENQKYIKVREEQISQDIEEHGYAYVEFSTKYSEEIKRSGLFGSDRISIIENKIFESQKEKLLAGDITFSEYFSNNGAKGLEYLSKKCAKEDFSGIKDQMIACFKANAEGVVKAKETFGCILEWQGISLTEVFDLDKDSRNMSYDKYEKVHGLETIALLSGEATEAFTEKFIQYGASQQDPSELKEDLRFFDGITLKMLFDAKWEGVEASVLVKREGTALSKAQELGFLSDEFIQELQAAFNKIVDEENILIVLENYKKTFELFVCTLDDRDGVKEKNQEAYKKAVIELLSSKEYGKATKALQDGLDVQLILIASSEDNVVINKALSELSHLESYKDDLLYQLLNKHGVISQSTNDKIQRASQAIAEAINTKTSKIASIKEGAEREKKTVRIDTQKAIERTSANIRALEDEINRARSALICFMPRAKTPEIIAEERRILQQRLYAVMDRNTPHIRHLEQQIREDSERRDSLIREIEARTSREIESTGIDWQRTINNLTATHRELICA